MNLPFTGSSSAKEDQFHPFPDLSPRENVNENAKKDYALLAFSIFIFASSLLTYSYFSQKNTISTNPSDTTSTPPNIIDQAEAKPTPKPLPSGKQIYNYSHGKNVSGPRPTQAIIDPIDPQIGDPQTLTIKITHDNPINQNASITLKTDNGDTNIPLTLESRSDSDSIWTSKWTVEDTYEYIYQIEFILSDKFDSFMGGLAFR